MNAEQRQHREMERRQAVEEAVPAADEIILEASDGSNAETDFLTGEVARAFVEKVTGRLGSRVLQHDMEKK